MDTPAPSLNSAYRKLTWGEKRLQELRTVHGTFLATLSNAVTVKQGLLINPGGSAVIASGDNTATTVPDELALLAGEVAGHFRSALDYLIGQLANLDSGPGERRTQFPIESTPEGFTKRRNSFLEGVNDAHVAAIERLQPYRGCEWTKKLRDVNNLDKHNDLIVVAFDYLISGRISKDPTEADPTRRKIDVKVEPVILVTLRDQTRLLEALQKIESEVAATLDAFKPEFK